MKIVNFIVLQYYAGTRSLYIQEGRQDKGRKTAPPEPVLGDSVMSGRLLISGCHLWSLMSGRLLISRRHLILTKDKPLPYRAVFPVDEEPPHRLLLVVPVPGADAGPPLQGMPEWKAQQKILWVEVRKESGRRKDRLTIRGLLADVRCSQAVLDFLSTMEVRRLVPPEEDARSEVSEWDLQERRKPEDERRVEAEEPGSGEGLLLFLSTPSFMASADEE